MADRRVRQFLLFFVGAHEFSYTKTSPLNSPEEPQSITTWSSFHDSSLQTFDYLMSLWQGSSTFPTDRNYSNFKREGDQMKEILITHESYCALLSDSFAKFCSCNAIVEERSGEHIKKNRIIHLVHKGVELPRQTQDYHPSKKETNWIRKRYFRSSPAIPKCGANIKKMAR